MKCEPFYYSGLSDCEMLFKDVIGAMIMDKGTTLSDAAALATYTAIYAGMASQTGMYLPIGRGYQNNTAEPERTTTQVGFTEKVNDPLPMLVGFLDRSYCDYKTLYAIDNHDKDVVLFLKNGKVWHSKNSAGAKIGLRAKISIRKNAPAADNSLENFPIYMDFKYIEDMDNAEVTTLNFSVKELNDAIPVGLNIDLVTAYAAGDVVVNINKRCTLTPFADITDQTSFEVLFTESGSTDLDIDVTAVDKTSAAVGRYTLTVQRNASSVPADLTSGVWIRAVEDDGSNLTYVSAPFLVKV
ncbi:hypothetical protein [Mariniphaga sediminis]|uniref:hypothetical protein n=1 Tax=Mariniphaga sediminis TaxID=1628158 RepID=UPI0035644B7E